jgi:glycosyltransferase involved in cell wall biosynthesis
MRVSVIIATYNAPVLLRRVLSGYAMQDCGGFDILVADDGSGPETRDVIERFARELPLPIQHIWHEDAGFRKTIILNRAIEAARGEYLIFTDGDCIPRNDFVSVHVGNARPGRFLSGGVEPLSRAATEALSDGMVDTQELFDPLWLADNRERPRLFGKVNRGRLVQQLLRRFSPTAPTFNGHNSSAWKKDILSVNGFDERLAYGGLDRELGERLVNRGVTGKSVRHDAILVHQWHERPYATPQGWSANSRSRQDVRMRRLNWTNSGIGTGSG